MKKRMERVKQKSLAAQQARAAGGERPIIWRYQARRIGGDSGEWTLVDAGDLVVYVMLPAVRDFYDIDTLWGGEKPTFHAGAAKPWHAADN